MDNQSHNWRIEDYKCKVSLLDEIEHNELAGTHFSMDIKSKIVQEQIIKLEEVDDVLEIVEKICLSESEDHMRLDLFKDESTSRVAIIDKLHRYHNVPRWFCGLLADKIVDEALFIARSDKRLDTTADGMVLCIAVSIDVHVDDQEPDVSDFEELIEHGYMDELELFVDQEPDVSDFEELIDDEHGYMGELELFVAASKSSIDKLERVRVEVSETMCTICMEEIMVGSEATYMPCSHLYHGGCIVKWLEQSRFCPLCRFSMPTRSQIDDHIN